MKNAMKKLMSLLLVAVLLASVIPFAALADEMVTDGFTEILIYEKIGDNVTKLADGEIEEDFSYPSDMLRELYDRNWGTRYEYGGAYETGVGDVEYDLEDRINAFDVNGKITIYLTPKATQYRLYVEYHDRNKTDGSFIDDATFEGSKFAWSAILAEVPGGYLKDSATLESSNVGFSGTSLVVNRADSTNISATVYVSKASEITNEETTSTIIYNIEDEDGENLCRDSVTVKGNGTYTVSALISDWRSDWKTDYDFESARSDLKGKVSLSAKIGGGDDVTIVLSEDGTGSTNDDNDDNKNDDDDDSFSGNDNNKGDDDDDNKGNYADGDDYYFNEENIVNKEESNQIRLYVYLNGKMSSYDKYFNIRNGIAKDGVVSLNDDVKDLLKDYYTAKNSDGLQLDGIYLKKGNWLSDWSKDDDKYETIYGLKNAVKHYDINLVVCLNNAKVKSSGTADSSNPKTGDEIFMAVTVLGLSSAALATMFYLNKKRMAK